MNNFKPYRHYTPPLKKRLLLAAVDALESAWAWAHSPTGDAACGLALVGFGPIVGVCLAALVGAGR
ncbi:MAG: hypothetical protein CMLOHMNK_02056 [Steroidobacteraceae bacterium]|nr:hypothetical protein [Steroidobacteraceae bacterium]